MNHPESTIDFLIGVAREAIRQRAARDHVDPEAYNVEEDPDGFVTSLLIALRHWCNQNNLDWDRELYRAEDCYLQDLDETREQNTSCPTIAELRCPECGHAGHFFIQATENLLLFANGDQLEGGEGPQWGRSSSCVCPECGRVGAVFQFHAAEKEEPHHG